ncbi:hypothetical protein PVBG_06295 [Plasmodium vivax Brazil I]|uniref:PIR Superfamily Protein n=1 Tax=Plasmodium vivax (strain Brazil I) TaxID=1033975 RepID=A0A0J9SN37_PLAV1|nr:hypothetical protein PVBG_06295 [Plasmodium vivax Brazil I]
MIITNLQKLKVIFTYVNKFPEFNTIISGKEINSRGSDNGKCKSFKDVELIAYSDPNNSFTDTCKKIAEHHQEIINKAKSSQIALCKYINYWIYDTLQSMPEFSHNKLLNKFYEKIEKLDFCKPYRNSIDKRTYDELKELYNVYEPYIKFKKASSKNDSKYLKTSLGKSGNETPFYVNCKLLKVSVYDELISKFKLRNYSVIDPTYSKQKKP